jgi:pimeloyl-ACP methyl ester carboxylesterase
VIDIPTEKYFDKYKPWFLKWMGKLGDSLSDVWEFYTRNSSRIELCREIRQQIKDLQATGYEVDIIAHSLGTMAALCSGPNTPANLVSVNRTILLSSPLGIGNLIARLKTNGHAERFSKNFITKELYYTWSEKDFVSERFTGRINDILASKSHTQPVIIHTGLSHSSEENLTYLLNSVEMYK